ncbi:glycosyltransferase family 4 protein [Haloarcula marina]|uniref:glycosyltransferase family 4 protein n=1 Tax=Haloarcula marina TaxID=2961574 RepID=UPI0020B805CE|nr:glycosyltransferase family 4 protein [Halomicroarcula marina]
MRIVVIPFGFFSDDLSSPSLADFSAPLIADRISLLTDEFDDVTLIAGWQEGESMVRHPDGNRYVTIRTTGRASIVKYLYRAVRELGRHRDEEVAVVNFNPHIPGCLLAAYCDAVGIPFVTYFIGLPEGSPGAFDKHLYTFRFLLRRSDGRICLTPKARDRLQELAGVDIEVVPNGVHPMFRPDAKVDAEENLLLYVGRFAPEKRLPLLVRAFARVRERGVDTRLVLIGARRETAKTEVKELAAELGVASSVEVYGRIPRESVPEWMNRARSVVLPSRDEGFGMVLMEAMACGTPPIGMDSGSVPWVIDDAGQLCADEDELVDALERIVADDDYYRQQRERALNRASKFTREQWGINIRKAILNSVA